jgi:hypothetical protein
VGFVVDKVALGYVLFRLHRVSPVSVIPPMLHTHLHLNTAVTRRTNGRTLGETSDEAVLFRMLWEKSAAEDFHVGFQVS